jgi:hypothetical protein
VQGDQDCFDSSLLFTGGKCNILIWPDSSLCTLLTGCKYKMIIIICLDSLTLLIGGKCTERIWIYFGPSSFFFQKVSVR